MSEDLKHTSMLTSDTETRPAPAVRTTEAKPAESTAKPAEDEGSKPAVSAKAQKAGKRPFEEWAAEAQPPMARGELYRLPFFARWPIGKEVTKDEFEAARKGAASVGVRAGKHPPSKKAEESTK